MRVVYYECDMATRTEERVETVSFRIPGPLKDALDAAAQMRGDTATTVLKAALHEHLGGERPRVYELPGFTQRFDDFLAGLEKQKGMQAILLMVAGRDGRGYVYDGIVDLNLTGSTVVAVKQKNQTYVIPKAYVVGWEGGSAALVNRLAIALASSGWTVVTKGYM